MIVQIKTVKKSNDETESVRLVEKNFKQFINALTKADCPAMSFVFVFVFEGIY